MSTGRVYLRYFFGFVKMVLSIPIIVSATLASTVGSLIPVPFIGNLLIRFNHTMAFNILMLIFGRYRVNCTPTPLIKKIVDPEAWKRPKRGTIVFAPLTSFLNIVFMSARFSPIFIVPVDPEYAIVYGFVELALRLIRCRSVREGKTQRIEEIIKNAKRPVVVFAEAAVTNGSGILKFVPIECDIPEDASIQVLGFTHQCEGVSPNFVCGNSFRYLLQIYGTMMAGMSAVTSLEKDSPRHSGKLDAQTLGNVREVLSKLLRIPMLELGADDRDAFVRSYSDAAKLHTD